ncbi:hypothetical protein D3C80_1044490 [compost metagenome]
MHTTKSTLADMRYVLSNLSDEFVDELDRGKFSREDVRRTMKSFIADSHSLTLWNDDGIIGMLGYQVVDGVISTAFPSTPAFFAQDTARFGRKLMRGIQSELGNLPIVSHSYSNNTRVEKWYRIIGYELQGVIGNRKVFRLFPK